MLFPQIGEGKNSLLLAERAFGALPTDVGGGKEGVALRPPFTPAFQASLTEAINRSGI